MIPRFANPRIAGNFQPNSRMTNRCWWDHHDIQDEGQMIVIVAKDLRAAGAKFCSLECLLAYYHDEYGSAIIGSAVREWEKLGEYLRKQYGVDRKQIRQARRAVTWKALKSYGGHLTLQQFRACQTPRFLIACETPAIPEPVFAAINTAGILTLTRQQQQQQQRRVNMNELLQTAGNSSAGSTKSSSTPAPRALERPTQEQLDKSTETPYNMAIKRARKGEMSRTRRIKDHTAREPNRLFRNGPAPKKQGINTFFTS